MRSMHHYVGATPVALVTENVDVVATFRQVMSWFRLRVRYGTCGVLHGGHELYRAQTATRLYQECLLCGYETPGWTIDRRDRRVQLSVSQPLTSGGRRTA